MRIAEAEPRDLVELVRLGKKFVDEVPAFRMIGVNGPALQRSLRAFIQMDVAKVWIAVVDYRIVGSIGMCMMAHPWNQMLTASELFWFVDKEHRGGKAAALLYARGERWAREQGAQAIQMVSPVGVGAAVPRIYHKRGFRPIETTWWKAV